MKDDGKGIRWKQEMYQWSGVTNPNRCWWQFWKPKKANIILTFHYHYCEESRHLKLGHVNLEIKYG